VLKSVLSFPLMRLLGEIVVFAAALTAFALATRGTPVSRAESAWVTLGLLVGVVALVERYTVGRGLKEAGFAPKHALRDAACGLIIGAALFCAVIGFLALLGDYRAIAVRATPAPNASGGAPTRSRD
jgi:heme A synthase